MESYPLLFTPVYKDYIWGGRNLESLNRHLPPGKVAEVWEIAAHPDGMSQVENGPFAGQTLQELLDRFGLELIGENNRWALERGKFPLLVKLLDANQDLSVQVHPDDAYARKHEGNELGKTEMWVVLRANPDAAIIYGLSERVSRQTFQHYLEMGRLSDVLNKVPIRLGDHVCVPAGTVHAILGGSIIAEIQQNSNTTYRVFDWNRTGPDGKGRPLHVDQALDVIDFDQVNPSIGGVHQVETRGSLQREVLCKNPYFTTERYHLASGCTIMGSCDGSSLEIWGLLEGRVDIAGLTLDSLRFVLLPANMGAFDVFARRESVLLRTFVESVTDGS